MNPRLLVGNGPEGRRASRPQISGAMGFFIVCYVLLSAGRPSAGSHLSPDAGQISPARICRSYRLAMKTHLDYCRDWLEQGDAKSLRATVGSLRLLTRLADYRYDSPDWNRACREFLSRCDVLLLQARGSDLESSGKTLSELDRLHGALAKIQPPAGDSAREGLSRIQESSASPPKAALKSWMDLMEGVHTDAKAAISLGETQSAKDYALILSDVAQVLSRAENGKNWMLDSHRLMEASRQTALFKTNDSKELRKQFQRIRSDCQRCHDRR